MPGLAVVDAYVRWQKSHQSHSVAGLLLIGVVLIDIYLAMGSSSESRDLSKLIHFVRSGSIVVHEMQKERGMYAGYLGSGRRNFVLGLP
jgi:hypothetical protein